MASCWQIFLQKKKKKFCLVQTGPNSIAVFTITVNANFGHSNYEKGMVPF